MAFREKYFALPGDMNNAEAFWGSMTNCDAASPSGTGTETCNGNNDGLIFSGAAASQTGEIFGFWQHLENAGLIQGTYTGIAGTGGAGDHDLGTNSPRAKISGAGWHVASSNGLYSDAELYLRDHGHLLEIGGSDGTDGYPTAPAFTPLEAWSVDDKIDDGKPAYGNVISRYWNDACAAANDGSHTNDDLDADYKVTDTDKQCTLRFIQAF